MFMNPTANILSRLGVLHKQLISVVNKVISIFDNFILSVNWNIIVDSMQNVYNVCEIKS